MIRQKSYESIIGGSDSFTIIGPSGIGKSSAVSRAINILTEVPVLNLGNTNVIACLQVQAPADSSVKGLLLEILRKADEMLQTNYHQNAMKSHPTVLSDSENGLFFLDGTKQGKIQLAINLSAHFVWNENLVYILQGNQPFGNAFLPYGFIVFWQDAEFIIKCLTHYHFRHCLQYIIHQLHPQYLCVVVSWQIFLQSENL